MLSIQFLPRIHFSISVNRSVTYEPVHTSPCYDHRQTFTGLFIVVFIAKLRYNWGAGVMYFFTVRQHVCLHVQSVCLDIRCTCVCFFIQISSQRRIPRFLAQSAFNVQLQCLTQQTKTIFSFMSYFIGVITRSSPQMACTGGGTCMAGVVHWGACVADCVYWGVSSQVQFVCSKGDPSIRSRTNACSQICGYESIARASYIMHYLVKSVSIMSHHTVNLREHCPYWWLIELTLLIV